MSTMNVLLAALALGAGGPLLAQGVGEIHGKVADDRGEPLPFAVVIAEQGATRVGAQSDEDGRFVLKPLPAGTYTVSVDYVGLKTLRMTDVQVEPDRITRLPELVMQLPSMGPDVVITRYRVPLISVDDPTRMTMTATQIESNPLRKSPLKMIASFNPGVTKAPNGDGLYFRGARTDAMCYFVDGVKMQALTGVPPDAINTITVYTGGLPAKYGDVTGGVVAIETKSYFDLYQQRNTEDR